MALAMAIGSGVIGYAPPINTMRSRAIRKSKAGSTLGGGGEMAVTAERCLSPNRFNYHTPRRTSYVHLLDGNLYGNLQWRQGTHRRLIRCDHTRFERARPAQRVRVGGGGEGGGGRAMPETVRIESMT